MATSYTPFVYPRKLHKRKYDPRSYSNYRKYKSTLSSEFDNKCVYCRIPDGFNEPTGFGVDHYKPKKKFPSLETEYSNLYYCCNACNSRKGDYWPSISRLKRSMFIPNPCDHVMSDHVGYYGSKVRDKSRAGEFMIEFLDLNELARIEFRNDLLSMINIVLEKYKRVRATVRALDKLIRTERDALVRTGYEHSKNQHLKNLNKIKDAIFRLTADKQYKK